MTATRTLYGFHAVTARLRAAAQSVRSVHLSAGRVDARARDLVARCEAARITIHFVDDARLAELAGSPKHQGVVALIDATQPVVTLDDVVTGFDEPALLLVLDGVTDPHNLGACLRSADAFGAHAVIVPKDRSAGINATVAKAASGAVDSVSVVTVTNLARAIDQLKEHGIWVLGADAGGESIFDADLGGPVAWVMGAEGGGLRRLTRERCDRIVGIPLAGTVSSLNVSVAAGICLYATRAARHSS